MQFSVVERPHFQSILKQIYATMMIQFLFHHYSDLRPRNSRHGRQHLGRRIIFYSIYAWGVPFIIVLVGQILDHVKNLPQHIVTPGFGEVKCWFFGKLPPFFTITIAYSHQF